MMQSFMNLQTDKLQWITKQISIRQQLIKKTTHQYDHYIICTAWQLRLAMTAWHMHLMSWGRKQGDGGKR